MASILARQFVKLHAPHCPGSGGGRILPALRPKPVSTPLILDAWRRALQSRPAQGFMRVLLKGVEFGFQIGLHSHPPDHQVSSDCPSVQGHSSVIDDYIHSQTEKWYMAGKIWRNVRECQKAALGECRVIAEIWLIKVVALPSQ